MAILFVVLQIFINFFLFFNNFLPFTFYKSVTDLPDMDDYEVSNGRTYMYFEGDVLYPFGYGLSYTKFKYTKPKLLNSNFDNNLSIKVQLEVTNIGDMDGDEVVQLYIRDKVSSVTRPVKELKGYKRVHLKIGETKKVIFEITPDSLAFYDIDMNYVVESGAFNIMTGSSSNNKDLKSVELNILNKINFNN